MIEITTLDQAKQLHKNGKLIGEFIIDDEVYHHPDCPGISRSKLSKINKSYNHFLYEEHKETPALLVGRALHDAVLMDNLSNYTFFDGERRTKAGKEAYQELLKSGKEILKKDDYDTVKGICDSSRSNSTFLNILEGATNERAFFWTHEETGILCKCKPDILRRDVGVAADLKSTPDARYRAFLGSVTKYSYDMQAAYYMDGVNAVLGADTIKNFIFIPVEKSKPYEMAFFSLNNESIQAGREIYTHALKKYRQHLDSSDIESGYSKNILTIGLADWALYINNRV